MKSQSSHNMLFHLPLITERKTIKLWNLKDFMIYKNYTKIPLTSFFFNSIELTEAKTIPKVENYNKSDGLIKK